jgi:hypothetical protein
MHAHRDQSFEVPSTTVSIFHFCPHISVSDASHLRTSLTLLDVLIYLVAISMQIECIFPNEKKERSSDRALAAIVGPSDLQNPWRDGSDRSIWKERGGSSQLLAPHMVASKSHRVRIPRYQARSHSKAVNLLSACKLLN